MHLRDYIEELRRKPEPVRKMIALGSSAAVTGLVLVAYIASLAASDRLALSPRQDEGTRAEIAQVNEQAMNDLLGAAGAFRTLLEDAEAIYTVETKSESTFLEAPAEDPTVIPF